MTTFESMPKNYNFNSKDQVIDSICREATRHGLTNYKQWAYITASCHWETAETFKPVVEAFWMSENWRRHNLRYYPFVGKGYIQITWKANYQKFSKILGMDLVNNTDLVLDPRVSLYIMIYGFKHGTFTGRKLEQYITNSKCDYVNARRCINGTDKASKIAAIAKGYENQVKKNSLLLPPPPVSTATAKIRKGDFSVRLAPGQDSTWIKYDPTKQASEIPSDSLKFELLQEQRLEITWFEDVGNHYKFELEKPRLNRYNWYAFDQHVQIYDDTTDSPILDDDPPPSKLSHIDDSEIDIAVPYLSQRDNKIRPHQTCNMTCAAMVVKFFHPERNWGLTGSQQLEDQMTQYCTERWGRDAIYYHNRIVQTLEAYDVISTFSTTTSFSRIKDHLQSGNPAIYSGKFTRSGHIIVLRGFHDTGFIVNDPWGEWFANGYDGNKSGKRLIYSYDMISRLSYSGSKAGWCHLCTKKGE